MIKTIDERVHIPLLVAHHLHIILIMISLPVQNNAPASMHDHTPYLNMEHGF